MNRLFTFFVVFILTVLLKQSPLNAQSYYSVGDMIFCIDASGSMRFVLSPNSNQQPLDAPPNVPDWPTRQVEPPADIRWDFTKRAFRQLMRDIDSFIEGDLDVNNQAPKDGWVGIVQFPHQSSTVSANVLCLQQKYRIRLEQIIRQS